MAELACPLKTPDLLFQVGSPSAVPWLARRPFFKGAAVPTCDKMKARWDLSPDTPVLTESAAALPSRARLQRVSGVREPKAGIFFPPETVKLLGTRLPGTGNVGLTR